MHCASAKNTTSLTEVQKGNLMYLIKAQQIWTNFRELNNAFKLNHTIPTYKASICRVMILKLFVTLKDGCCVIGSLRYRYPTIGSDYKLKRNTIKGMDSGT